MTRRAGGTAQPTPPFSKGDGGHAHGRHGWMMIGCCIPMLVIAVVLVATGIASVGLLVIAVMCMAMMALMMGAMSRR